MAPRTITVDGTARMRQHLALLLSALLITVPVLTPQAEAVTTEEATFAAMANDVRSQHQARRLRVTERLSRMARRHSKRMAAQGELYHSNLRRVFRSFDYRMVGENVGYGGSLSQLMGAFMNSPPHAHNLLGNWRRTGVGVYRQGDRIWITQLFYL